MTARRMRRPHLAAVTVVQVLALTALAALPVRAETTVSVSAFTNGQWCLRGGVVAVALTAVASHRYDAGPVTFQWDLNNDGRLDTQPRETPNAIRLAGSGRSITARIVATPTIGDGAASTVTFVTRTCP